MFCEKCGAQIEDDSLFCPNCGSKIDSGEGEEKKKKKLPVGIAAAVVTVVCLVTCVVLFGRRGVETPLIYLKDNEMVSFDGKEKNTFGGDVSIERGEIYPFGGNVAPFTQFSQDGKYLFYPQNYEYGVFDLYCKRTKDKEVKGEKLASSVENYAVLKNGKVVYQEGKKLYISDSENREKIASDVIEYTISGDEGSIFWITWENRSIYACRTDSVGEKRKLDSDIDYVIYSSDDFDTIVYRKDKELYCLKNLEDRKKITSESVTDCCVADSGERVMVYYLVDEEETFTFRNFIENDLSNPGDEAQFLQGSSDWQKRNMSTLYCYDPEIGENTEYASGFFPFGIHAYSEEIAPVFSYLCCDVDEAEKVKLSTIAKWNEEETVSAAKVCGEIWKNLSATAKLHLVSNGRDELLDYDGEEYGWAAGIGSVEKTNEYYIYAMPMDAMMQMIRNEESRELRVPGIRLSTEEDDGGIWKVSVKIGGASASVEEEAVAEEPATDYYDFSFTIFKTDSGKMDGKLEPVAEDIGNFAMLTDGGIYYRADLDEDMMKGELFFDGSRVDSDVMLDSIKGLADGDGILYLTDYDDEDGKGTLKMYTGGETRKIADDVMILSYHANQKGEVAFLTDYSWEERTGDLKRYNNKKVISIDSDVTGILSFE